MGIFLQPLKMALKFVPRADGRLWALGRENTEVQELKQRHGLPPWMGLASYCLPRRHVDCLGSGNPLRGLFCVARDG